MATPHLTGVVALLLSAQPDLSVDATRELLESTARTRAAHGEAPERQLRARHRRRLRCDHRRSLLRHADGHGHRPGRPARRNRLDPRARARDDERRDDRLLRAARPRRRLGRRGVGVRLRRGVGARRRRCGRRRDARLRARRRRRPHA